MRNGPVLVVTGPAGVGKSTVSRLVAETFDRSVHVQTDDLMASIVRGWVDPNEPGAQVQNRAIGAALAVGAIAFAEHGYAAVADGIFFPDGVDGLASACRVRGIRCHYVVLDADLDTCWARASGRGEGRWPLVYEPFANLHARFGELGVAPRHVVGATVAPDDVCRAVLAAYHEGRLEVGERSPGR